MAHFLLLVESAVELQQFLMSLLCLHSSVLCTDDCPLWVCGKERGGEGGMQGKRETWLANACFFFSDRF